MGMGCVLAGRGRIGSAISLSPSISPPPCPFSHPPTPPVVASEKGVVVGRLSFREDGDFIDCRRMGVGGKAIPPNIDKVRVCVCVSGCVCLGICF